MAADSLQTATKVQISLFPSMIVLACIRAALAKAPCWKKILNPLHRYNTILCKLSISLDTIHECVRGL